MLQKNDGFGIEPGVWFRLSVGGITGHKDFAKETGIIVKPVTASALISRLTAVVMSPRQFVRTDTYFGPSRRRRTSSDFEGPNRRRT